MSRWWSGRLSYRKRAVDGSTVERGREDFRLSRDPSGGFTMRCVARTDDSGFVRDVVHTVDGAGRPVDTLLRLRVGERWIGTGYLHCEGEALRVTADSREDGHVVQEVAVPRQFHVVTHAVMLDGWVAWAYDEVSAGEQELVIYNTSTRWDGTDGPNGRIEALRVWSLGERELEVPAGRYDARGYGIASDVIDSPPAEVWVTGPGHVLLRYDWPGLGLVYELETLHTSDS